MLSKAVFIHSQFHPFLRKTTWEWMGCISNTPPIRPFPAHQKQLERVGMLGNGWEYVVPPIDLFICFFN